VFIVRAVGVQEIVQFTVEPGDADSAAAGIVPVNVFVVELKVTVTAVDPTVRVHDELNPFVELANETGDAVFW
jgi:hypothetical protein